MLVPVPALFLHKAQAVPASWGLSLAGLLHNRLRQWLQELVWLNSWRFYSHSKFFIHPVWYERWICSRPEFAANNSGSFFSPIFSCPWFHWHHPARTVAEPGAHRKLRVKWGFSSWQAGLSLSKQRELYQEKQWLENFNPLCSSSQSWEMQKTSVKN